jgi:hypothetical protein
LVSGSLNAAPKNTFEFLSLMSWRLSPGTKEKKNIQIYSKFAFSALRISSQEIKETNSKVFLLGIHIGPRTPFKNF